MAKEFYQNVVQREASEEEIARASQFAAACKDSLDRANMIALSQPDC